jgi:transglutaminase-like putative cysteine protease
MNTPPFLLAAAALFWATQTGQWLVAVAAVVLMEGPRYRMWRWTLEEADLNRVADFCTVLLLALALYFYVSFGNPRAITLLFQWMPVALAPIAVAVAWSTSREINLSVLFWSLRRAPMRRRAAFNPGYALFVLWLLAASAANREGGGFQVGLVLLGGWALWPARPRSHALAVWVLSLAAAASLGYAGHVGLHGVQQWLEVAAPEWIAAGGSRTNPYRSTTDIGAIGDIKLAEGIVLRVNADPAWTTPILLHRASYDVYRAGAWFALSPRFESIAPVEVATRWRLNPAAEDPVRPGPQLSVYDYSASGNPVLSLPIGVVRIESLAASDLKTNALGAVQAEHQPGFFSYVAVQGAQAGIAPAPGAAYSAPGDADLRVPPGEAAAIAHVAGELQLASLQPAQALAAVRQFFAERFQYSLWQGKPAGGATPLADFLLTTRAGHCEYFATATTLLLRAAGIPARYATGFSVQEPASLGEGYVVRERHAHAWVRAWVDGAWRDVDTTPPDWFSAESARAPFWSPLADVWSWLRFGIARHATRPDTADLLGWLAVPLGLWIAWRIRRARRALVRESSAKIPASAIARGRDSEFYLVEGRLSELGYGRRDAEALFEWLRRVALLPGAQALEQAELAALVRLHYRHRFDPSGLPAHERKDLHKRARDWLARHPLAVD